MTARRARSWAAAALVLALGCGDKPQPGKSPATPTPAVPISQSPNTPITTTTATATSANTPVTSSSAVAATPSKTPVAVAALKIPPIVAYERACARCHGPQGRYHWDKVAQFPADKLATKVQEMMRAQGQLKPTPADVEAMTDYHKAMINPGPGGPLFITANNLAEFTAGKAAALKGEVTSKAQLNVVTPGGPQPIVVSGNAWTLENPPAQPFELRAALDGKTITLRIPDASWTH